MTARLVSLNVGRPRDVAWQGKTVRTAIWKAPVTGPRMVRRINIDGDDQGDRLAHGGEHRAVFVYQLDSYRYWERELGRDDLTPGQFGENFTVEGLADDEVCIGDRYRVGAALFEVTQPRVTCYRVGIRMDEPAMPSLLVAHHRPGFYLRVLEEGEVQAGDAIEKVADGPERLTIAQVDALLYLPGKSRALLERALRVPALSEGWKGSFRDLLARADGGAAAPAWTGFRPMRVAEVRAESATIASLRLVPDGDDAPEPAAAAGQYLTVRVPLADGAAPLTRSYSLSDVPGATGFRISVKRDGTASRRLHDAVRAGDVLEVAAPRGAFVLRPGDGPVVLLSAGVGATPVLAMLHALARDAAPRPVWWVHGARDRADHAFGPEVDALLAALPDAHRVVAYSRPAPGDTPRRRLRRRRPSRPRRPRTGRRARRRRPLPLRPRRVHARHGRRPDRPRRPARARRHRGVRRGRGPPVRDRRRRRPPAPPPRRPGGNRADGQLRPQRPRRALGRPLAEPARPRRGVRRAGRLRLPHRGLPQLRVRAAGRRRRLRHRAARAAGRRARARVLHAPVLGADARPLDARPSNATHGRAGAARQPRRPGTTRPVS